MATKTITTPVGIARYPSLNRPDTKFDDIGVYKVNLEMSSEDAEPFIKQIEALFAEFLNDKKRELKKDKLKLHAAPWEDNDGLVQLKLKVKAMGKNKEGEDVQPPAKALRIRRPAYHRQHRWRVQSQSRRSSLLLVHSVPWRRHHAAAQGRPSP
jgi:hypothetical protein